MTKLYYSDPSGTSLHSLLTFKLPHTFNIYTYLNIYSM